MYLNTHSYYSLRYGTLPVEELVKLAVKKGIRALALTDINNTTGMPDFVKTCHANNVKPIGGMDFFNGDHRLFTALARNNKGFREINEFLSRYNLAKKSLPALAPEFDQVYVIYPPGYKEPHQLFENEFIGIKVSHINRLITPEMRRYKHKMVLGQAVTFANGRGYELHRHLRAVDNNILLSQLKPQHLAAQDEVMLSMDELREHFRDYPEILRNTEILINRCGIDFDFTGVKNKQTFTGNRYDDKLLLEKLALDGLAYRYGKDNKEAARRVYHELDVIYKLGFAAYFLITWDIIRYSMSQGFYHVGRGSGANSVVAYCLRITDVDPIELDLYFERFINPKRSSPPDFDIDYSWKERDMVLDYIFKRYGRKHTALLGTMSTFKGRSIIRELGKVYGLPKAEIDSLVNYPNEPRNQYTLAQSIIKLETRMTRFPNLRSIHAGGVLISEEPITTYTALDLPPKAYPTTQWDMYIAEDLRFEKLDILSQRGIGHIKEAVDIIRKNKDVDVDVHRVDVFKNDSKTKKQLRTGETNGCFYIESPAMRGLLKKLHCDNYITLVAASSIIRPGVAKSGMMKEYIHRFHHPGKFDYLHPVMKEQLEETYGVMVYQEDVIKICHHFAGLDLADADVLRRAMSGKYRSRSEFQRIVDKFFENCHAKGYPEKLTKEVWRQIESFAGYSFSKAHSASYAVESFQSLFLKAHFPLEFMVAVINNFGGFYRSWVYINEARRQGASIELPCVNNSFCTTSIQDKTIYLGFIHLQNLERKISKIIGKEREAKGPFDSLDDFVARIPVDLEQLIILIRISAFRFTGKPKQSLLWEAHLLVGHRKKQVILPELFQTPTKKYQLPPLEHDKFEDAFDEIELLGFPVSIPFFEMLQTGFRGEIMANDLGKHVGQYVRMVGNLATIKYVRTIKQKIMNFAAFLDTDGAFFDTVHFPPTLKKYPFRGHGIYLLKGKVVEEFGFSSLEVEKMAKLPIVEDPRFA